MDILLVEYASSTTSYRAYITNYDVNNPLIIDNTDDNIHIVSTNDNTKGMKNSAIIAYLQPNGVYYMHATLFARAAFSVKLYCKTQYDSSYWLLKTVNHNVFNNGFYTSNNVYYREDEDGWACYTCSLSQFDPTKPITSDVANLRIFNDINLYINYIKWEVSSGATVKVSYYLPDDTYTYSKLTYNSEHEPEDKDDGTSIDILPSNTSVNVEGLEEDTLYYFTIFTNKSESEPFPFVVGEVSVPPGPTPPEPSVERKDLIYCNWGSGNVTFRATIGQQYSFRYNNIDYDDCYYPFAFWTTPEGGQMYVVGGDLDNYGASYIYYNCASYSGSKSSVQQLDNACPIFDSFNADCLTWARRGYL